MFKATKTIKVAQSINNQTSSKIQIKILNLGAIKDQAIQEKRYLSRELIISLTVALTWRRMLIWKKTQIMVAIIQYFPRKKYCGNQKC